MVSRREVPASAGRGDVLGWARMQQQPEDAPRMVPPGPTAESGAVLPVSRPLNSLAVVSLVAGIAGYVIPHPFIAGLVAIVTGHLARGPIRRHGQGGALVSTTRSISG